MLVLEQCVSAVGDKCWSGCALFFVRCWSGVGGCVLLYEFVSKCAVVTGVEVVCVSVAGDK